MLLPAAAARRAAAAAAARCRAFSTEAEVATAFRRFGHLRARIDPLGVLPAPPAPELDAAAAALPAVAARYAAVYCGTLGAEFEHCDGPDERAWWAARLEATVGQLEPTLAQKKNAWALLEQAEQFELFLQRKFTSLKRYSGEGTESLLPAINEILAQSAAHGVRDVVVGQAHRGRLGLLVSLMAYPVRKMLWKIFGNDDLPASVQGLDDVSSHIAASVDRAYPGGSVHVSLLHNPSHLEFVNPVAAGKTRAKQAAGSAGALCLLIHGDAAVSGQVRGAARARAGQRAAGVAAASESLPPPPDLRFTNGPLCAGALARCLGFGRGVGGCAPAPWEASCLQSPRV
jgi:2-oxoglutarate dehydrogenase complex dehydrogenase (E1) component-like enzyme